MIGWPTRARMSADLLWAWVATLTPPVIDGRLPRPGAPSERGSRKDALRSSTRPPATGTRWLLPPGRKRPSTVRSSFVEPDLLPGAEDRGPVAVHVEILDV